MGVTRIAPLVLILAACNGRIDASADAPFAGGEGLPTGNKGGTLLMTEERVDGQPVVLRHHDAGVDASKPPPLADASAPPPPSDNGITWHGGPIMTAPPKIYFVWYGNWKTDLARNVLVDWAAGIGGTAYWAINATYPDGNGHQPPNAASFGGQSFDDYSRGKVLTDALVERIVADAITTFALPKDPNGVYFVLGSKDVDETSGLCSKYCGWHSATMIASAWVRYGFIGDGDRCPASCEAQAVSPNYSPSADAMASVLSHELEETVTDPLGNAWFDAQGNENADKCAWTFGPTQLTKNGARYNVSFGGRDWLIQRNWVNAKGGYCAMHL